MEYLLERIIETPLCLSLVWEAGIEGKLKKIHLDWAKKQSELTWQSKWHQDLILALRKYLQTGKTSWPDLPLDWKKMSSFRQKVLKSLQQELNFGHWISYSELAKKCGNRQGARAIGGCMRNNPWPLILPCHRVLRKDGHLGGFSSGLDIKQFLLELENIKFKP